VIDALDETTKATVLSNGYNDSTTLYTQIGKSAYNNYWKKDNVEDTSKYVEEDNAGVGYMYGNLEDGQTITTSKLQAQTNTNDSTIKAYIDNWYATNLAGYETYISDTLFCNDRSIQETIPSGYSNLGFGIEPTAYRWYSSSNGIKLTCQEQNDRFTVDDEVIGNGDLTYPIGLLTTDEAYLAGGSAANSNYYLYTGNIYWTMSPCDFDANYAYVEGVNSHGNAGSCNYVGYSYDGARPVINLKSGSLTKGSGSASDPWMVD